MNFKKHIKTLVISALACAALTVSAAATSMGGGVVSASGLYLRSQPSSVSSIITMAPRGAAVVLADKTDDGWYRVWFNGYNGYMSGEYLDIYESLDASFGSATIGADQVRLRAQPDTSAPILETCELNTEIKLTGISGKWFKVSLDGQDGYVSSDYINLSNFVPSSAPATVLATGTEVVSEGQKIVNTAMQYLGTPYVWAGTSPSGFDCSGLVYYVFKECGYSTNRTAATLYSNGEYVEKENLQVGDIICFTSTNYSYIGHVGIYIGDGQFIHASSGSGEVVINDLSTTYYANHYYGARRIV